jgi:hypothetical protein
LLEFLQFRTYFNFLKVSLLLYFKTHFWLLEILTLKIKVFVMEKFFVRIHEESFS